MLIKFLLDACESVLLTGITNSVLRLALKALLVGNQPLTKHRKNASDDCNNDCVTHFPHPQFFKSAAQVWPPTIPSISRSFLDWKKPIAFSVIRPKSPSGFSAPNRGLFPQS